MIQNESRPPRRRRQGAKWTLRRRVAVGVACTLVTALVVGAGVAMTALNELSGSVRRSGFSLPGPSSGDGIEQNTGEANILLMGLDSRVDQNGDPLPAHVYEALRAGDASDGGYNANVLMLLHIPADGRRAVGISIPRDDYVDLVGAPNGVERSKIKEAYGLAFAEKLDELSAGGRVSAADAYQQARAAGRQSQISTVSRFLGDVRIDHFVEITMAAFYDVANAVGPITVCVNQATRDKYSGADFVAGTQELDAEQAMSFVRQRRDTGSGDVELTDFDRTRRQQAFLASLAHKLKQSNLLANLGAMSSLIEVAKQHIAVDPDLELLSFAQQAARLAGGEISFVTLPVERFATIDGKAVNLVDHDDIRATVARLLSGEDDPTNETAPPAVQGEDVGTDRSSSPSPSSPASSSPSDAPDGPRVYSDWREPLRSGAIPCVN